MAEERPPPIGLAQADRALSGLLDALLAEATVPAPGREDATGLNVGAARPLAGEEPPSAPACQDASAQGCGHGQGPPPWAARPFRVLLFAIGDTRLAMPLLRMAAVVPLPARLGRLPGQAAWQLGVTRVRGRNVTVADLGGLVGIGERCRDARYLLLIGDGTAAVACDRIEDIETVEPDAVRWPQRPAPGQWLAGLLLCRLCALVDPAALENAIRHA
jgi:chemotaxis signal transduction protein